MTDTYADVMQRLKHLDEISLIELLELTSEQIVDRFEDIIEENYDDIEAQV